MPISRLPTELDLKILGYLGPHDLSRLVRVNSYYHKIGEPLLYKTLKFTETKAYNVHLLMTLIKRTELVSYIEHVEVLQNQSALQNQFDLLSRGEQDNFIDRLASMATLYKNAIDKYTKHKSSAVHRVAWFRDLFGSRPQMDFALRLILVMASNVRRAFFELDYSESLDNCVVLLIGALNGPHRIVRVVCPSLPIFTYLRFALGIGAMEHHLDLVHIKLRL